MSRESSVNVTSHRPQLEQGRCHRPDDVRLSTGDVAIGRRAAELTSRWVSGPYDFVVLDGASPWIPEQVPDELAASILERIRSVPN